MAARCLGEMVKRMGDRILTSVLPELLKRLESDILESRRGVAIALSEIIGKTHRDIVEQHAILVVPAIKKCLLDEHVSVRNSAVPSFASFYHVLYFCFNNLLNIILDGW